MKKLVKTGDYCFNFENVFCRFNEAFKGGCLALRFSQLHVFNVLSNEGINIHSRCRKLSPALMKNTNHCLATRGSAELNMCESNALKAF